MLLNEVRDQSRLGDYNNCRFIPWPQQTLRVMNGDFFIHQS